MIHGESRTTVGSTTLVTMGSARSYAADQLVAYMREVRACQRAIRHLIRGTESFEMLRRRIVQLRSHAKQFMARRYPIKLTYASRTQEVVPQNHGATKEVWIALREAYRYQTRERRRTMREVPAQYWSGPDRIYASRTLVTVGSRAGGTLRCGVHLEPNQVYMSYMHRLRSHLYDAKTPRNDDTRRWVSVEIECILGNGSEDVFCDKAMPAAQWVCIKSDGSLRRNGGDNIGRPVEIVISAPISEIENAIKHVCKALAACNAYVNDTCGLHLHMDMRHFDRHVAYHNLVAGYNLLRKLVPEHRVKNRYCKPVRQRKWPRGSDRYKAINHLAWQRHRTLEVRLFAGCINATKIIGYVKLCSSIAYTPERVKRAPATALGWKRANAESQIDIPLINWVKQEQRAITEADIARRNGMLPPIQTAQQAF